MPLVHHYPCIKNSLFADAGNTKSEEQQGLAEDVSVEAPAPTGPNKNTNEDDTKTPYSVWPLHKSLLMKSVIACLLVHSICSVQ
jgi:hypothetical protein